ncbi:MAG: ABC transporter ATP-binding protein [Ignisphaera sp.]|nr:ABC transporter ATP-binding protein [Ignisphaera sp.]MCX8167897.1 ABC transporter ATP-binding protein [Ignisphaera sp.]MDW8085462.1 ABC transporter ATP-binding protein [Ignisphaera sp.]
MRDVNLLVKRGEIIGIHGPSGAGKTTLLKILAGLERPDSGEVIVEGYNLNLLDDDGLALLRTSIVSYIPQDYGLIDEFTVYENIELPLLLAGLPKRERRNAINSILDYMGLRDKERIKVKYLSGGEKQRVSIARSLVTTPSLLLADEPTANLDWDNAKRVLELFNKINKDFRTTIVIVSHDMRVLEFVTKRFVLYDGLLKEVEM